MAPKLFLSNMWPHLSKEIRHDLYEDKPKAVVSLFLATTKATCQHALAPESVNNHWVRVSQKPLGPPNSGTEIRFS